MNGELKALGRTLANLRRGNGRRYTPELRAQIAHVASWLRTNGRPWQQVAEEIGIPVETIRGFCGACEKARSGFVAVEVTEPVRRTSITLVSPGGYRVEGLGVDDAAELLRRLQ